MIVVEAKEAREKLDMATCIGLMREGLSALENGSAMQPLRSVNKLPHGNLFGFMPAYLGDGDYFGAKVITAFHANAGTEYNTDSVQILILDIKTGVAYRLLGHGDGILGIQVHLAGFLAVDVLVGIEVLHFACELGLE